MKDQGKTCPSSICVPGAKLLGIVNGDGTVSLLENPIDIDEDFVLEAQKGRQPEKRFRFANKCVQSGCKQWGSGGCGVINKVMQPLTDRFDASLPDCGIRKTCRWFFQEGGRACKVCPLVITDNASG